MNLCRPSVGRAATVCATIFLLGAAIAPTSVVAQSAAEAESLEQQGNRLSSQGQFDAAIESWRRALALRQALHDRGGEARLAGTIGQSYFEHGDYSTAIE